MRYLCLFVLLATMSTLIAEVAETPTPVATRAVWEQRFVALTPGLSRVEAEGIIATVRQIPSTYELWAMDTAALVAYRLDAETVLLVRYRPGIPAAHVSAGAGAGHGPVDGAVLEQEVLQVK